MYIDARFGFGNWIHNRAFLDGMALSFCFAADDGLGWADVYVTDDEGMFMLDTVGDIVTKRLTGKVEFRSTRANVEIDI